MNRYKLSQCKDTNIIYMIAFLCLNTYTTKFYLKISGKAHDFSRGMKAPQCFF